MVVVRGLSLDELIRRSGAIDTVIERELRAIARQAAGQLGQVVVAAPTQAAASPSDVNLIRTLWRELVDRSLLAHVTDALFAASRAVARDFNRILDEVLSEQPTWRPPDTRGPDGRRQAPPQRAGQRVYQPPPSNRGTDGNVDLDVVDTDYHLDPLDESQATEAILSNARNRLVGIGDELWEHARDGLSTGLAEGESVEKLAARVVDAADVTAPRARTIARTEVISACNAGSLLTMRAIDLATSKVWLATPDARTRLDHRLAQGQTVPLDAPFVVGGVPLDHPGDPAGPPETVINCRCSLAYDVEELPTPAGEDDVDDIAGFDPSLFPDIDFSAVVLHLPGRHNQGDHRNKKGKKSGGSGDGDGGGGGGESEGDDNDGDSTKEQPRGVEPRHPPAEPLSPAEYSQLRNRYANDYDMVGVDLRAAGQALDSYVGNDYADINGGMRRGNEDSQFQEVIDHINQVFDSGVLTTSPFVTYRGLGQTKWTFGKIPEPGDIFTDPAFGSTTANRETANTFLDGAGGTTGLSIERIAEFDPGVWDQAAVLAINVPTGSRVLPVDAIRANSGYGYSRESEILLPPNTSLRVTGIDPADPDSATPRVIHVEVVTSE